MFSEEVLETISKFCEARNVVLISDEIYSDICFDDNSQASACSGTQFHAGLKVLTGGLSKVSNHLYHQDYPELIVERHTPLVAGALVSPYSHAMISARPYKMQSLRMRPSAGRLRPAQRKRQRL